MENNRIRAVPDEGARERVRRYNRKINQAKEQMAAKLPEEVNVFSLTSSS